MVNANKNPDSQRAVLYLEDDAFVFVPKEVIDSFDKAFNWVKESQKELMKVAEAMQPIEISSKSIK